MSLNSIYNIKQNYSQSRLNVLNIGSTVCYDVKTAVSSKVRELQSILRGNASKYMAISEGMLPSPDVINPDGDDPTILAEGSGIPSEDRYLQFYSKHTLVLDDEQGENLFSAFVELDGLSDGVVDNAITITTEDGNVVPLIIHPSDDYSQQYIADKDGVRILTPRYIQPEGEPHPIRDGWLYTDMAVNKNGGMMCLHQVASSLVNSGTFNNAVSLIVDGCVSKDSSTVYSGLGTLSTVDPEFASDIRDTFAKNGPTATLSKIVESLKNNFTEDEDGLMDFTDNEKYTPRVFLSGIISGLVTVISTIASIALSIITPVLGAIAMLIGSLISFIGSKFSDVEEQSFAYYYNGDEEILPIAPYAIDRGEFVLSVVLNTPTHPFYSIACDYNAGVIGMGYSEVPGGMIIFGPGPKNGLGQDTVRWEFHPSVNGSWYKIHDLWKAVNLRLEWNFNGTPDNTGNYNFQNLTIRKPANRLELLNDIQEIIYNYGDDLEAIPSDSDSSKITDHDLDVRLTILANAYLYTCWKIFDGIAIAQDTTEVFDDATEMLSLWGYYPIIQYDAGTSETTGYLYDIWSSWDPTINSDIASISVLLRLHHDLCCCLNNWYPSNNDYQFRNFLHGSVVSIFKIKPLLRNYMAWDDSANMWNWTIAAFNNSINFGFNNNSLLIPCSLYNGFSYLLIPPRYNLSKTILTWALIGAVTAAATGALIVSTVGFKKWRRQKLSNCAAGAADAWDRYTKNPTPENYAAYQKAAKRNNRWATILGGSKVSRSDYWFGDNGGADVSTYKVDSASPDAIIRLIRGSD